MRIVSCSHFEQCIHLGRSWKQNRKTATLIYVQYMGVVFLGGVIKYVRFCRAVNQPLGLARLLGFVPRPETH